MYGEISNPVKIDTFLSKKVVLDHIIQELPKTSWTDLEIIDWLPEDDNLLVEYCFADTLFGQVIVANTCKGICYLGLVAGEPEAVFADFSKRFSHCIRMQKQTFRQKQVLDFLAGRRDEHLLFHLRGTSYQTEIWRRLTRIPYGKVISYTTLAGNPPNARAAGTANGRNPVFWIIPCHRVVKTTGDFDRYFWGEDIKKRLLAWEFVNSED